MTSLIRIYYGPAGTDQHKSTVLCLLDKPITDTAPNINWATTPNNQDWPSLNEMVEQLMRRMSQIMEASVYVSRATYAPDTEMNGAPFSGDIEFGDEIELAVNPQSIGSGAAVGLPGQFLETRPLKPGQLRHTKGVIFGIGGQYYNKGKKLARTGVDGDPTADRWIDAFERLHPTIKHRSYFVHGINHRNERKGLR